MKQEYIAMKKFSPITAMHFNSTSSVNRLAHTQVLQALWSTWHVQICLVFLPWFQNLNHGKLQYDCMKTIMLKRWYIAVFYSSLWELPLSSISNMPHDPLDLKTIKVRHLMGAQLRKSAIILLWDQILNWKCMSLKTPTSRLFMKFHESPMWQGWVLAC